MGFTLANFESELVPTDNTLINYLFHSSDKLNGYISANYPFNEYFLINKITQVTRRKVSHKIKKLSV